MDLSTLDISCFQRAIQLAIEAEAQGNLPIGAVICLDGRIIAEGRNAIWSPTFNPNRHAEIEALRSVPQAPVGILEGHDPLYNPRTMLDVRGSYPAAPYRLRHVWLSR